VSDDILNQDGLVDAEWLINQVAHALRNPIFAAMMQVEALQLRAKRAGGDHRSAEAVSQQLNRLEATIQDMLLYGRPASVTPRKVRLQDVPIGLSEAYAAGVRGTPAQVAIAVGEPDVELVWDPDAVRTILERLLDNAVQHSTEPVRIEVEAARTDETTVCWSVTDHGEGLAEGILDEAFLPFRPQHRGRPGLGLAIALKLARAMGGTVALAANPSGGAIATLCLPLTCPAT
jgi:signal transduction histidine kinase